jgi:threonine/homoserine/homoserine lactone efflux protein
VDRAGALLRPRATVWMERVAGGVMVALGTRLAVESG